MTAIPLTIVRHDPATARTLIREFVYGGMFGPAEPPRGLPPESVLAFAPEIGIGAEWRVHLKAAELYRFYESVEVAPPLLEALEELTEPTIDPLCASAILTTIGDLGTPELRTRAATVHSALLDDPRVTLPALRGMIDAAIAIENADCYATLEQHVDDLTTREERRQDGSVEAAIAFDKVVSFRENDVRRGRSLLEERLRINSLEADASRPLLVEIYLGRSPMSDPSMQIWAARKLRAEAREDDSEPVIEEFLRAFDSALSLEDPIRDFVAGRAGRAVLYLMGELGEEREAIFRDLDPPPSFLWDENAPAYAQAIRRQPPS